MSGSGRPRHRDHAEGGPWEEPVKPSADRLFKISDAERQQIARALRYIDQSRHALEAQQNADNREIIRELRASTDRIFDVINGLEETDP